MYDEELPETYKENLAKLKEHFWQVLNYIGDDELISSCNTEYNFDSDDVIRTDGSIVIGGAKFDGETSIRGASYVIIASRVNGEWRYDLRVENTRLGDKFDAIMQALSELKETIEESQYYIDEWRV